MSDTPSTSSASTKSIPFVGDTFARAAAEFERTGTLPARPDVAELVLRGALLAVDAAPRPSPRQSSA